MKVGKIIKELQPKEYKKLKKKRNRRRGKEHLSLNYVQDLMKHDSYSRHNGAIKQRGWGK